MASKMRSITKVIIAVTLITVLLFSQVCFAVAAEAPWGGNNASSVARSKAVSLTATDDELKELEKFFDILFSLGEKGVFEYDSKRITYEDFLNIFLADQSGESKLYGEYFNSSEAIEYEKMPDPLDRFGADEETAQTGFYYRYTKENIDWILQKIFNASPAVVSAFNAEGYDTDCCYYYDGSFYVSQETDTVNNSLKVSVTNCKQYENGRYTVDVKSSSAKTGKVLSSKKAVVSLKEISGVRRWTVYYVGGKDGVDEALKNNPLVLSVDNNSFANYATDFITYPERARYYTNKENLQKLTANRPENLQNLVNEYSVSGWDGSCYGIAASMALSFTGKIDLSLYREGDTSFYKMEAPSHNKNFRSLINYYQLSQLSTDFSDYKNFDDIRNNDEEKKDVLKSLTETVQKGEPVIIGCRWKSGAKTVGHVVVGCAFDKKEDGSYEITLVDPDNKGQYTYLTVSKDFSQCSFKGSNYDSAEIVSLGYMTADDAMRFAEAPLQEKSKQLADKCIFILEQDAELTVTNASGEKLVYNENGFSGDMPYNIENYILAGNNHQSEIMITVENSESFTVENEGKSLDITVSGSNGIFCGIDGTNVETVSMVPGEFTVTGKDMAYSISALSDEDGVDLINLRGRESREITVACDNGVTVSSERKQTLRVALVSSDGELKECDYQPQDFKYSITNQLIEVHVEMEKTNHIRVLVFFVMFAVLVAAAAVATVVIVKKKRKRNAAYKETE